MKKLTLLFCFLPLCLGAQTLSGTNSFVPRQNALVQRAVLTFPYVNIKVADLEATITTAKTQHPVGGQTLFLVSVSYNQVADTYNITAIYR